MVALQGWANGLSLLQDGGSFDSAEVVLRMEPCPSICGAGPIPRGRASSWQTNCLNASCGFWASSRWSVFLVLGPVRLFSKMTLSLDLGQSRAGESHSMDCKEGSKHVDQNDHPA